MELLRYLNNEFMVHFEWLGLGLWALVVFSSVYIWHKYRSLDALIVSAYITGLMLLGWFSAVFQNPLAMAVSHILLLTALISITVPLDALHSKYGDVIKILAVAMISIDILFYMTGWWVQVHQTLVSTLYVSMCLITYYAILNSHKNGGRLGAYIHVGAHYRKAVAIYGTGKGV